MPAYRLLRTDSLMPAARNPRLHSPAQIDKLAKLITEFGWTNPVLIDGARGVIAGHGRLLAAQQLGLDEVPTIELAHLSAAQRRAYMIADNQSAIAGAGWNAALLRLELADLRDLGCVEFSAFDVADLKTLLVIDDDAAPAAKPRAVQRATKTLSCPHCGGEFAA